MFCLQSPMTAHALGLDQLVSALVSSILDPMTGAFSQCAILSCFTTLLLPWGNLTVNTSMKGVLKKYGFIWYKPFLICFCVQNFWIYKAICPCVCLSVRHLQIYSRTTVWSFNLLVHSHSFCSLFRFVPPHSFCQAQPQPEFNWAELALVLISPTCPPVRNSSKIAGNLINWHYLIEIYSLLSYFFIFYSKNIYPPPPHNHKRGPQSVWVDFTKII